MPAAFLGWQTQGTYGMRLLRAEGRVRDVTPGTAADRAGIVPGDRIDIAALGIGGHFDLLYPSPGERITVRVAHEGTVRTVSLVAGRLVVTDVLRWLYLGAFLTTAAFIVVGATLVFLRPAPMTWWLWLYCIGIAPINQLLAFYSFLPDGVMTAIWMVGRTFFGGFSVFPLLPFVLRFPRDRIGGWRGRLRAPMIALVACLLVYYVVIAWYGLQRGLDNYSILNAVPAVVMYALAAGILIATFLRSRGTDRQRLKWAVTGMLFAFGAQLFEYIPGPIYLAPTTDFLSIVMPVTVAYAALRHRLIDIEFVANRAIVYGVLTALLLSFVSLIDWLTSRFISEYHLALYLEAGATIGIGFVLDRLHGALEAVTDRFFFRSRHVAEQQIELVARSLSFANRLASIEEALVDEPVHWLALASAAIFRRDPQRGVFVRGRSIGWHPDDLTEFPDDAPVARYLQAERAPLTARAAAWKIDGLPNGAPAPALYVPIFARHRLHAIAVYGAHTNSALPDPGENALLATLAPEAGLAFDHLEFQALSARLAEATGPAASRLPETTP
jgi:hypothetical protein